MNKVTKGKLFKIIKEVLGVNVTDGLSMDTVSSWDSLRHIQLLAKIEHAFKIEVDFQDTLAMTSVKSIKQVINKYQGEK